VRTKRRAVGGAGVGATKLSSAPGAPFVSALRVLVQWGGGGRRGGGSGASHGGLRRGADGVPGAPETWLAPGTALRRCVAPFLLIVFSLTPLFAQSGARVEVKLFPETITVGDRVTAELALVGAEEMVGPPRFPSWRRGWGDAEVLEASEPERVGDAWRQRLVLTGFAPGALALPPVEVVVPLAGGTVKVLTPEGVSIEVRSVLPPGDETPKPKAEKPPVGLPIGEAFWWSLAVGGLLLAGAIALYAWSRRGIDAGEEEPALEPLPELLGELERLAAETSSLRVHTRLSHAFRRYLGRAAGFPALERTTTEIHRQLLGRRLPAPVVRGVVELLRACDLVKFARQEVGRVETAGRVERARSLGEELERELRPPDLVAAAEGAAAPREAA
jgi:hypothetical protein